MLDVLVTFREVDYQVNLSVTSMTGKAIKETLMNEIPPLQDSGIPLKALTLKLESGREIQNLNFILYFPEVKVLVKNNQVVKLFLSAISGASTQDSDPSRESSSSPAGSESLDLSLSSSSVTSVSADPFCFQCGIPLIAGHTSDQKTCVYVVEGNFYCKEHHFSAKKILERGISMKRLDSVIKKKLDSGEITVNTELLAAQEEARMAEAEQEAERHFLEEQAQLDAEADRKFDEAQKQRREKRGRHRRRHHRKTDAVYSRKRRHRHHRSSEAGEALEMDDGKRDSSKKHGKGHAHKSKKHSSDKSHHHHHRKAHTKPTRSSASQAPTVSGGGGGWGANDDDSSSRKKSSSPHRPIRISAPRGTATRIRNSSDAKRDSRISAKGASISAELPSSPNPAAELPHNPEDKMPAQRRKDARRKLQALTMMDYRVTSKHRSFPHPKENRRDRLRAVGGSKGLRAPRMSPLELLNDAARSSVAAEITDLLFKPDCLLAQACCTTVSVAYRDVMLSRFVRYFLYHDRRFCSNLIGSMARFEIRAHAGPGDTLFRSNAPVAMFLSLHAKIVGASYLKKILSSFVRLVSVSVMEGAEFEVDPHKFELANGCPPSEATLARNVDNVVGCAVGMLVKFLSQVPLMPGAIRRIAREQYTHTRARFPDFSYKVLGGYVFLRYVCPGLITPERLGVVPIGTISMETRRALMIISKCLQQLANGQRFGDKETYMTPCNAFIDSQQDTMRELLDEIVSVDQTSKPVVEDEDELEEPIIGWEEELSDVNMLFHHLFYDQFEELLAHLKHPHNAEALNALDYDLIGRLCALADRDPEAEGIRPCPKHDACEAHNAGVQHQEQGEAKSIGQHAMMLNVPAPPSMDTLPQTPSMDEPGDSPPLPAIPTSSSASSSSSSSSSEEEDEEKERKKKKDEDGEKERKRSGAHDVSSTALPSDDSPPLPSIPAMEDSASHDSELPRLPEVPQDSSSHDGEDSSSSTHHPHDDGDGDGDGDGDEEELSILSSSAPQESGGEDAIDRKVGFGLSAGLGGTSASYPHLSSSDHVTKDSIMAKMRGKARSNNDLQSRMAVERVERGGETRPRSRSQGKTRTAMDTISFVTSAGQEGCTFPPPREITAFSCLDELLDHLHDKDRSMKKLKAERERQEREQEREEARMMREEATRQRAEQFKRYMESRNTTLRIVRGEQGTDEDSSAANNHHRAGGAGGRGGGRLGGPNGAGGGAGGGGAAAAGGAGGGGGGGGGGGPPRGERRAWAKRKAMLDHRKKEEATDRLQLNLRSLSGIHQMDQARQRDGGPVSARPSSDRSSDRSHLHRADPSSMGHDRNGTSSARSAEGRTSPHHQAQEGEEEASSPSSSASSPSSSASPSSITRVARFGKLKSQSSRVQKSKRSRSGIRGSGASATTNNDASGPPPDDHSGPRQSRQQPIAGDGERSPTRKEKRSASRSKKKFSKSPFRAKSPSSARQANAGRDNVAGLGKSKSPSSRHNRRSNASSPRRRLRHLSASSPDMTAHVSKGSGEKKKGNSKRSATIADGKEDPLLM